MLQLGENQGSGRGLQSGNDHGGHEVTHAFRRVIDDDHRAIGQIPNRLMVFLPRSDQCDAQFFAHGNRRPQGEIKFVEVENGDALKLRDFGQALIQG